MSPPPCCLDEWGTTYRKTASSWPLDAPIDYPIRSRSDLARYRSPDPSLPGRLSEVEAGRQAQTDNLALLGGITGPFTTTWLLMGFEQISYSLYDDPALLTELFKISNECNKEAARLLVSAGVDGIFLGDDFGDSRLGFLKLDHFRRYLLPYVADLVEYVHNLGVPVLLHSCGRILSAARRSPRLQPALDRTSGPNSNMTGCIWRTTGASRTGC